MGTICRLLCLAIEGKEESLLPRCRPRCTDECWERGERRSPFLSVSRLKASVVFACREKGSAADKVVIRRSRHRKRGERHVKQQRPVLKQRWSGACRKANKGCGSGGGEPHAPKGASALVRQMMAAARRPGDSFRRGIPYSNLYMDDKRDRARFYGNCHTYCLDPVERHFCHV